MKQLCNLFLIALLTAVATGCTHDRPSLPSDGEEGIDSTFVEVAAEVTLDLRFLPFESGSSRAYSGTTKATEDHRTGFRRRFIVEAWREGKAEARQMAAVDATTDGDGRLTLPFTLKLHAVEYTLAVWTDYIAEDSYTDLYYDTKDLQYVSCTAPYTGSTDYRDCLYGTAAIDLRPYRDKWNAKVVVKADMVRPLAKYEIIATDVKDFLRKTAPQRKDGATYTITFAYGFYLPTVFNVLTGKPADSRTGVQFTTPLDIPADGREECAIGSDFVFVNGTESFVKLTIEIRDDESNVVARTTGLEVPYRRGHLTTVRARFLTNEMQGGVDIDPGFNGNIDVDIDDLM